MKLLKNKKKELQKQLNEGKNIIFPGTTVRLASGFQQFQRLTPEKNRISSVK